MSGWRDVTLGDFLTLQRGFDLTEKESTPGEIPVISSGGFNYTTNIARVQGPGVITGRKGVLGKVHWSDGHATGIYTFAHLFDVCPCPGCLSRRGETAG